MMTTTTSAGPKESVLEGLRVLIVEDAFLVAVRLQQMVEDLGCEVIGPVPTVADAMEAIAQGQCEAAILDINLGDETAEPIAERLESIGLPFFFVTGYASPTRLGQRFGHTRRLRKPVDPAVLETTMLTMFNRRGGS